jgi:hypothetical protein
LNGRKGGGPSAEEKNGGAGGLEYQTETGAGGHGSILLERKSSHKKGALPILIPGGRPAPAKAGEKNMAFPPRI